MIFASTSGPNRAGNDTSKIWPNVRQIWRVWDKMRPKAHKCVQANVGQHWAESGGHRAKAESGPSLAKIGTSSPIANVWPKPGQNRASCSVLCPLRRSEANAGWQALVSVAWAGCWGWKGWMRRPGVGKSRPKLPDMRDKIWPPSGPVLTELTELGASYANSDHLRASEVDIGPRVEPGID